MAAIKKEKYDDIAADYSSLALKMDESAVVGRAYWVVIGDVIDKSVLDIACGDGFYTRQFKEKGASKVVGMDICTQMIEEGRKKEAGQPLGILYRVGDAVDFDAGEEFDLVTAQYLLCNAETKIALRHMCVTMYNNTKPGEIKYY